jgi:predicted nucleic acid-binding protein
VLDGSPGSAAASPTSPPRLVTESSRREPVVILVDTSIWVDHLRAGDDALADLLEAGRVLGHPWVTGEIALGDLVQRREVLRLLDGLPQAYVASIEEMARFVETHRLYGLGIGYVDVQLLGAARLTGAHIWSRDRRLVSAAQRLDVHAEPASP